ncbi:DMT family transporter [Acidimangrovimonas sediminis]|uniref:DMT family transporter n=1 Tax=Acidimangrovimonas sediminis TaxID=2056283 RepID=UPI001E61A295|nr:DMT family transporter [Acidimangrovimonas sediminis]
MHQDRIPLGTAFMLGFCMTAPLIDVASKLAAATIPVGEITFARFFVQACLMIPVMIAARGSFRLRGRALRLTLLRAGVSILATYSFVAAVREMPIADALAIAFVEPFIILLLGWALYGEQVGPRRITASAVGFAGALLVIQPSFAAFGAVALFPLGTAFGFAFYILITRQLSPLQTPVEMQFHTALVAVALWVPFLAGGSALGLADLTAVLPQGDAWFWLVGVGAAATASHLLMSFGLRLAPAATLAPLHYLEMVSAATFGYLVFGNFPDALTWLGIGIIVASGLYLIHRERQLARRPAPVPAPLP